MALIRVNKAGASGLNVLTLTKALGSAAWVEVGDIPANASELNICVATYPLRFIWQASDPTNMQVIGFSSGSFSQPVTYSQASSISTIAQAVSGVSGGSSLLALKVENGKLYQAYNYTNTDTMGYDIFY